jgi:hypothetical protein
MLVSASVFGQTAQLQNQALTVTVRTSDGSYEVRAAGVKDPVLTARVGVQVNHSWIWSTDYARHEVSASTIDGPLGPVHQLQVSFAEQAGKPSLKYILQTYDDRPFGNIQVQVGNPGQQAFEVQSIRGLDAIGEPRLNLQGPEKAERVLSDSYSEDRPTLRLFDLGQAPEYQGEDDFAKEPSNLHQGVGSQLVYNQQSKYSLFLAALTSDRLLTMLRLNTAKGKSGDVHVASYAVDSTGTTEVMKKESIKDDPPEDQIELSLTVAPGKQISSETLAFTVGQDYHAQLESYGEMIRILHHARIPETAPWGWWSWTAYYFGLAQGNALTNARWLAQHFKKYGFEYFHIDEGYAYEDGEFMTPNAMRFPDGIGYLSQNLCRLGLKFGIWVAPFRVGQHAWVYENHPEWLLHNKQGKLIQIGFIESSKDPLYILDITNPAAQDYFRRTFEKLSHEWGARYFKLDFMDDTAIEAPRYQPDVTGLEAERMGLKIVREAVGDDVLIDKDGSPMLNTVGLTDLGRTSTDTGHSFYGAKEDAPGIMARYYMNNNFYVADPDAFSVARQLITDQTWHQSKEPLSLDDAEVSITLAAIAGGMFEIGDDLPTLGKDPDRVALVENKDLLDMVRLKRESKPLDLMTYAAADEQPSITFLQEDKRQAMLTVFNWTDGPRSHEFKLSDLGLSSSSLTASDVFHPDRPVALSGGILKIENQQPRSVRLIKIVDGAIQAAAPTVKLNAPTQVQLGVITKFSATVDPKGVPALAYHWEFGDGVSAEGRSVDHAYTQNGNFTITLKVDGLDGVAATQTAAVTVSGELHTLYDIEHAKRFQEH